MKKILLILVSIILLASCKRPNTNYVVTYNIYYGNSPALKTRVFEAVEGEASAYLSSDRGTNRLHVTTANPGKFTERGYTIESTSAPIEIISVRKQ